MTEERHLFLDLDGLLQTMRTHVKLYPEAFAPRTANEDLRLDAKWLTAFMTDQNASVAARRVTFLDWDSDGVADFVKLGWQEKSKGNRRDHLSFNSLLRANLQSWGAATVSDNRTLVLAVGEPTESVLKCVASYLEASWSVELCCLQQHWKSLPKKATQRCRGYHGFEKVFLDGFVDQLALRPSTAKFTTLADNLQQTSTAAASSLRSTAVGVPCNKMNEVEAAGAKLEATLSVQLEKYVRDAVTAFKADMLQPNATIRSTDRASNNQQARDTNGQAQREPWILPRQNIATTARATEIPRSNQEEADNGVSARTVPDERTTAELTALKRQMHEMRTAFSALNVGISTQAALRRENQELRQRVEQQTRQIAQLQISMDAAQAERLQFEDAYEDAVEAHRAALARREEIMLCPVTQSLLEAPMVTVCCGHAFSRSSLQRVQACPICRRPVRAIQDRAMEAVVAQFREESAAFTTEES